MDYTIIARTGEDGKPVAGTFESHYARRFAHQGTRLVGRALDDGQERAEREVAQRNAGATKP